jgi:hypothetical protein
MPRLQADGRIVLRPVAVDTHIYAFAFLANKYIKKKYVKCSFDANTEAFSHFQRSDHPLQVVLSEHKYDILKERN